MTTDTNSPDRLLIRAGFLLFTLALIAGFAILAAAWGTSRLTPLASPGFGAAPWQESVVQALHVSLALAIVAGAVALRPQPAAS